jgi:flagellar FliL protein
VGADFRLKTGAFYSEEKSMNVKKIISIVLIALNLSVLGLGVFWVYSSTLGYESPTITEKSLREPAALKEKFALQPMIYTMDKFVVNLSGLPKRTIRLQVNLDMIGPEAFQEIMDLENRAKARDKIVRILNEKTFDDLESIQGKLFLKDKIVEEVNRTLDKGLVKDVYFTDFVMN